MPSAIINPSWYRASAEFVSAAFASAAKAYYEKAATLGNEDAKAALKRAQCPYVIKDKRGNVVTTLCF